MKKRRKLSRRESKNKFQGNAGHHPKNMQPRPQRGGYRL